MTRVPDSFLESMLAAVLAALFVVMAAAFLSIPHSLGGHPAATLSSAASATQYHPT